MENEDCQSVSENEIDASTKQDSSSEEAAVKTCVLDNYDSCKLKTSLLKLKLGMPEESGGAADCEKDLQESSSSAEKKINGEVTESVPKENGSSSAEADHEMAPLSIDVEESVEEGRASENKKVESSLKRKLETTNDSSSSDEEAHSNSPVEFRGFKKRMIAKAEKSLHRQRQVSETENCPEEDPSVTETENTRVLRSTSKTSGASDKEQSGDQLTEYAQYLGLQPTVKFKCYRCGEKNFQTMAALNEHQTNCREAATAKPHLSPQVDTNTSTNFRITRKVFLCSACGTYYENWKLFLHMRDMHKRHICLYCLGMFAVADKLAEHLVLKHKVTYQSCSSPEAFLNISKGSGYLICLTCERLFTERENFFDHECRTITVTNSSASSKESTPARSEQPNITLNRNSQLTIAAGPATVINKSSSTAPASSSLSKRFVSVPTLVRENWAGKAPVSSEFIDVSSFCHVDLKDAQSNSSRKSPPSSSIVKDTIVVSDDEEPNRIGSTQSTNTSTAQKAIQKMFPTLRRLSDLMEKKVVEGGKSRTEIETPTKEDANPDKSENSSSQENLKNRKTTHNELPQARKNPLRLTRSVSRNFESADVNSLEKKKKSGMEVTNKQSSSSDSESIGMNLAEKNEAISREDFSVEDNSDSSGVIKKPKSADISISRENAQKDKNLSIISNSTLDKSKHVFPPSPPLLMEVENESDNESLDEELVGSRHVIATNPVLITSKTEEIKKTTEANKPVIEKEVLIVLERKLLVETETGLEVNDNKTEEADKGRGEKEVDENNKVEDNDKNKKLEKSQVEEEKDQSILCDESPTEKPVEKNSVVENVVPNGPSSSQEKSIVPYEDSEKEEESEDEQPAKEIDESCVEHDNIGDRNNVEHDVVDDKSNKERDKVDDESNVEDNKIDDRTNVEHDTVDDESNEEDDTVDKSNEESNQVDDKINKEHNIVDDESNKEHNTVEDESNKEHNTVEDESNEERDKDDDESKEEHKESNDEEQNENNENGVTESANDSSENNNKSSNEDNKSVDSDDSDKLSVALSEDTSDDENSKSENENRNDTKSNDDNIGHSESESQAMTNHSEELLNGGDESETQKAEEPTFSFEGETMQIASKEVMAMALTLEDKMECLSAQSVIKECIRTSCTTCGYCNHAVKIGVNGKQLAAHLLAEHRYKPVKNETVEDVIDRLKHALSELKDVWFNTDSYDSSDKSCFVPFDHTYECFQCNFVTNLLKDLISHKRKVHQKTILYCSMCKANFYSYSELLCHMCPGLYVSEDIQFRCCFCEIDRIPSAFRLMVHLRKTHHTCDVCLEIPGDQQKLSTHMWKHKLHHICYRCGIAYRNKPDITKHLFWKHGTESVLCKKCLQKKWPHVYHFCIPPTVFICEECNISFSRAVALKVHKRIHAGDFPYSCSECSKKFVSRKILDKHVQSHNEPIVQDEVDKNETASVTNRSDEKEAESESVQQTCENRESEQVDGDSKNLAADKKQEQSEEHLSKSHKKKNKKDRDKKSKPVVDVYDLPPLNLSSESDDSDDEMNSTKNNENIAAATAASSNSNLSSLPVESSSEPIKDADISEKEKHSSVEPIDESDLNVTSAIVTEPTESLNTSEDTQSAPVVDGIWDNFHFYKAEQEKRESSDPNSKPPRLPYPLSALPEKVSTAIILGDHDYCYVQEPPLTPPPPPPPTTREEHSSSMDHDYCATSSVNRSSNARNNSENGEQSASQAESKSPATTPKKKQKSPKKSEKHNSSSSSDSSSDSDSSSCSNSNCSCCSSGSGSSSSSSSDSDSSSSEGKRGKRDRKKEKTKSKKKDESVSATAPPVQEEEPVVDLPVEPEEPPIRESDLDTDESSTEEDFYDQYPQRHANQMLAEKRNQLMVLATVAPVNNGISSPPPEETPPTPISAPPVLQSSPPPLVVDELPKPSPVQRRGGRKKRRRGGATKNQNSTATPSQFTYEAQPSTSFGRTPPPASPLTQYSTPQQNSTARKKARPSIETDSSKRLSKRRRVPNKFYGYSSDEEEEIQQAQRATPAAVSTKWRRVEAAPASPPPPPQPEPAARYHSRIQEELSAAVQQYSSEAARQPAVAAAVSSSAGGSSSGSSASSGSESDSEPDPIAPPPAVVVNQPPTEKDEKLYCYCQCPYDEVSEMIACDGNDCTIEWFHFECVGIMVPPKGKWYCPDCKRRRNLI
ncbi:hypothetical protein LSTR_LSTR010207 [Laodelphax striatellus]|uniref:Chromatin modification-related protein YNG2 n=1 Tax=Laodelphax striatellus TaxID=195883 RepID=A0A482WQG1_LAOST|nr:hypothetical protein LSTR_LSTR010207 [Laodelphax striatellus]